MTPACPCVVVPLDATAAARAALPVARALAGIDHAVLHLVHVSDPQLSADEVIAALRLEPDDLTGAIIDTCGGAPGSAIAELARHRRASTLVMGTGGPGPGRGPGAVAEAVLSLASVPVVFVRPEHVLTGWAPRALLLPLDGCPASASAIAPAIALASRLGGSLTLLHVAGHPPHPAREPGSLTAPTYADQPWHEWPEWSREFLERGACRAAEAGTIDLRLRVLTGVPGPEITRFAAEEHVDLIVMAWHGVFDPDHATTLRTVLQNAPCPVMVLRV